MRLQSYFDYAAATPLCDQAKKAMMPFLSNDFFNPSGLGLGSRRVKTAIEQARKEIAGGLGAKPTEVIFTAGGTEANNLAIKGIMNKWPNSKIVITAIEHDSVLEPAQNYKYKICPVQSSGTIDLLTLKKNIDDDTVLVSIMYANNEIGTIQPLREISRIIGEIRAQRKQMGVKTPLYFHTDACQAVNYLDLQVSRLGVDLMTINAGKIYGPKQCGALYVKSGVDITPLIEGGGQERNMRSGTENVANIVGFAEAFIMVRKDFGNESKRLTQLRDQLIFLITKNMQNVIINGPLGSKRLANNISVTLPGIDNERLLMELDEAGMVVALGSACGASSESSSHVLSAIGVTDELANNNIRISLGRDTTITSVKKLADILTKIVAKS